jgi:1-acyl-sn-glycerol-3-phosphate acyltransferase
MQDLVPDWQRYREHRDNVLGNSITARGCLYGLSDDPDTKTRTSFPAHPAFSPWRLSCLFVWREGQQRGIYATLQEYPHPLACPHLDIEVIGTAPDVPVLVVSNHISWLDIPVLAQTLPVTFLSKAEVRSWPVIGWVAAKGGTLFIQRGARNAADSAIELIEQELALGGNVLIFPEGTTTDGNQLKRFHPRLFAAAQNRQCPVQPVALRYPGPDELTHSAVPFINNNTFGPSLWKILGEKRIRVILEYAQLITDTDRDRRQIADEAHERVRQALVHLDRI